MTGLSVSWALSDEELVEITPAPKTRKTPLKMPRMALECPGHVYGMWMRVVGGRASQFRRFCRRCRYEQRGRGSAWGGNITPV